MKIFLTLVLFVLLSFPAIAQNKIDVEKAGLKGKVQSVESYQSWLTVKDGKDVLSPKVLTSSFKYDPNGHLTESVYYDADGSLSRKLTYTYDQTGNLIESTFYRAEEKNYSRDVCAYDEKGRNTGYDEYPVIGGKRFTVPRKHIYTLDEKGNRIEYRVIEADGSPGGRFTYKYNEQGKMIEQVTYFYTGKLSGTMIYTYDKKGNPVSWTAYDSDNKLSSKMVVTYDAKGRRTKELFYKGEALKYNVIHKYDSLGRIVEVKTTEPVPLKQRATHDPEPGKIVTVYDDRKNTKQIFSYAPDGSLLVKSLLTFNFLGDEIKQVTSQSNEIAAKFGVRINGAIPDQTNNPSGMIIRKITKEYNYDMKHNWTRIIVLTPPPDNLAIIARVNYIDERIINYW